MSWLGQKNEYAPTSPSTTPSTTPSATPSAPPMTTASTPAPQAAAPAMSRPMEASAPATRGAIIGKSIHVKGELSGNEDLAIEGKVEGRITLNGCRVTIGATGQVTADISAKSVVVGGQMKGSVRAEERVEVTASGQLMGDVRSPRVVLADGARFKGSVDMDANSQTSKAVTRDPLLVPDEALV